jgi:hypothetical protein
MSTGRNIRDTLRLALVVVMMSAAAPLSADDAAVDRALAKRVTFDFHETPLSMVVASLQQVLGIPIQVDPRALSENGFGIDPKITVQVSGFPADLALTQVGNAARLPWMVTDDGVLFADTDTPQTRGYDVSDLLTPGASQDERNKEANRLATAIDRLVDRTTHSDGVDQPAKALSAGDFASLVVSQSWDSRRKIRQVLGLLHAMRASPSTGGPRPTQPTPDSPEEQSRRVLAQLISIDFDQEPLDHVIKFLEAQLKVPVLLDARALDSVNLDPNTTMVSMGLKDVRAETVLDRLLHGIGLACVYENEVLLITTQEVAAEMLSLRVYDVSDLLSRPKHWPKGWGFCGMAGADVRQPAPKDGQTSDPADSECSECLDDVVQLIEDTIEPDSWSDAGTGNGKIWTLDLGEMHLLVISNTRPIHAEIEPTLGRLRALRHVEIAGNAGPPVFLPLEPAEVRIREALAKKVVMDFDQKPLLEIVQFLNEQLKVPVFMDAKALHELDIDPTTKTVTVRQTGTAESALNAATSALGLVYTYQDERLLLTLPMLADERLLTRIYDVYDLTGPDDRTAPWDVGGDGFSRLVDAIEDRVDPESWTDTGMGSGQIAPLSMVSGIRVLVVSQSWNAHRKIEAFLKDLRATGRLNSVNLSPAVPADAPPASH